MNEIGNLQIVLGIVLAWSFAWPVIRASREGPSYLLPGRPEPALVFALICSFLAIGAVPAAFVSANLSGWIALAGLVAAQFWADGPVWRYLLATDRLPVLWLAGLAGCLVLFWGVLA